jgi:hypothetical protein
MMTVAKVNMIEIVMVVRRRVEKVHTPPFFTATYHVCKPRDVYLELVF